MKIAAGVFSAALLLLPALARAEEPAPPASPWSGSFGAGLALTSGNTDTRNFNFLFGLAWDPKAADLFKADGLWIRGEKDGDLQVERKSAGLRYEHRLLENLSAFADVRFNADRFKEVEGFWNGAVGVAWIPVKNDTVTFSVDAGFGGYSEQLTGLDRTSGGAWRGGQAFAWKISPGASLTESVSGTWKSADTGDAVYHGELALATTLTGHIEFKVGIVDDYRTRPASPELEKNDVATVAALVVKY